MDSALVKIVIGENQELNQDRLISLTVTDKDGKSADTASLTFDDSYGRIVMPNKNDPVSIWIGWASEGTLSEIFNGFISGNPSIRDDRGGMYLSLRCSSVDPSGKAKQRQQRSWKDTSVAAILQDSAKDAGIQIGISQEYQNVNLATEVADGESFLELGARLAAEHAATFKVSGKRAIFVKANEAVSVTGKPLPIAEIERDVNYLGCSGLTARQTQSDHETYAVKYFDKETGTVKEELDLDDGSQASAKYISTIQALDSISAKQQVKSHKKAAKRRKGYGRIRCNGSAVFAAGGKVILKNIRPGIDGEYRCRQVQHRYSVSSGWIVNLQVDAPSTDTGKDDR